LSTYVALLRGIGPGNPNMRNDKLRGVFEAIGFSNVSSVISSGNIIFESPQVSVPELEARIEQALSEKLGLSNTVIIRSRSQLQKFVDDGHFAELRHSPKTYLTVTFIKHKLPNDLAAPTSSTSKIIKIDQKTRAICAVVDTTASKTPDFMAWLEKQLGKDITTRTFKTVERILARMSRQKI